MLRIQEKILLYRARKGDQSAFARLCDYYREKIYQYVYFRIPDQEKTEDLLSEIFTKVLDYLIKGNEIKNFRAFLYQTARNIIVDFYREKNKHEISLDEISELEIKEEKDPAKEFDLKLDLVKIEKALRRIPDRYREVIVLRYINELPFKEIAKITGENPTSLRQLVHRGLKLVKKYLQTDVTK